MAYRHDIFLSYTRNTYLERWIDEHLLPALKGFISVDLGRHPAIFLDRDEIGPGDTWPLHVQEALANSRTLLAIWSPLYFNSDWCRKECWYMLQRESHAGYRKLGRSGGLIVPINIASGEYVPHTLKQIQVFDFRAYVIVGRGFEDHPLHLSFRNAVKNVSINLIKAIKEAPQWNGSWLEEMRGGLPNPDFFGVPSAEVEPSTEPSAEARTEFEARTEIVSGNPNPVAVYRLLDKYFAADEVESARQFAFTFLEEGWYWLASIMFGYILEHLPPPDPLYSRILANKAYALIGLGRFPEAIHYLKEVRSLRPGDNFHGWHAVALAYAYFRVGNKVECRRWLAYAHAQPIEKLRLEEYKRLYPEIADQLHAPPEN